MIGHAPEKTRATGCLVQARNRFNSQSSTGPTSPNGKAVARRNALTHGLTANPAAGVAEVPDAFDALLVSVADRLGPQDAIEAGLVHRIAVALWRLQRAATVDGALGEHAVRGVTPERDVVQGWIKSIHDYWRVELVAQPVEESVSEQGPRRRGRKRVRHRFVRPALPNLDRFRDEEVMANGYAITAMIVMLDALMDELRLRPRSFSAHSAEQLAWVLGEPASLLPKDDDLSGWFLNGPPRTQIQRVIAEAFRRSPGEELSRELFRLAESCKRLLLTQRQVCPVPYDADEARIARTIALLPDEATLNRLARYETHAERSLVRCLETLARLRGANVETLRASMVQVSPDGTAVAMQGSRQTWSPGNALRRG